MDAPCTVASCTRMKFDPRSNSCCSLRVWTADAELQHGYACRVVLKKERRKESRRHPANDRGIHRRKFRNGLVYIRARVKVDMDNGSAIVRLGFEVLDIVNCGRQGSL